MDTSYQNKILSYWINSILIKGTIKDFDEKRNEIRSALLSYFKDSSHTFASSKLPEFISYLRDNLGEFSFTQNISMKIRPFTYIYIDGKLIYFVEKNIW